MTTRSNRRSRGKVTMGVLAAGTAALVSTPVVSQPAEASNYITLPPMTLAEQLLCISDPVGCALVGGTRNKVESDVKLFYGSNQTDHTKMNSFKHGWWMMWTSWVLGSREYAFEWGNAHEYPYIQNIANLMDGHNNAWGVFHASDAFLNASFSSAEPVKYLVRANANAGEWTPNGIGNDQNKLWHIIK